MMNAVIKYTILLKILETEERVQDIVSTMSRGRLGKHRAHGEEKYLLPYLGCDNSHEVRDFFWNL